MRKIDQQSEKKDHDLVQKIFKDRPTIGSPGYTKFESVVTLIYKILIQYLVVTDWFNFFLIKISQDCDFA